VTTRRLSIAASLGNLRKAQIIKQVIQEMRILVTTVTLRA
jgi:hypothetical protein